MKKEILKFLVLAMLAVGAGPVSAAVWQWSRTASSNATADSTINWAEGMSPSSVNDSARAMMARLADYRDDISGSILTAGTSTAYTLTSHQTFDTLAHMDGAAVAFTASVTNGTTPTLNVDGLGAKSIVSASGVAIPAGTLIANTPYVATYNNASSEFRMQGFYGSPYSIPLGGLMAYTGTSAPNSSFILPAGQCISTTTYAAYWVLRGSPVPGACAAGQFAVVDLRGRTLAALDNLNGSAASLMTNSATGCGVAFTSVGVICGNQSQTLTVTQLPSNITAAGSNTITVCPIGNCALYVPYATSGWSNDQVTGVSAAGAFYLPYNTSGTGQITTFSGTNSISVTSNNTSGGAHPIVQPTMAVTYLLRVI